MSHEHAVTLLGAYADDELPPEMRREVEAHLTECGRCVQELRVHMALRQRLQAEKGVLEPSDALMRLEAYVARLGRDAREQRASAVPIGPGKRSRLRHPLAAWGGWLVAASLAAVWALGPRRPPGQGMAGMSMGPLTPVAVDSIPESIADAALHDFTRVASEALPQGPELTAVESQVPFSVPALTAPHMKEMPGGASAALQAHNTNINQIYASNDLDDEQDFVPVIDAIQGDGFNPLWHQNLIVFNQGFRPHQFTSDEEVLAAAQGANPEITIVTTDEVYRCSVVGHK